MRNFTVIILLFFLCIATKINAQRAYRSNSVLAAGTWSKIAIKDPGIYKVDVAFLASHGFNTSNLSSVSIRLFGNGGSMLSERNASIPVDDLAENAILMVNG